MVKISKTIAIALIMVCGFCLAFTGCDDGQLTEESNGIFYSLQEAYDNGLLTQEDLQSIANYHNNGEENPESLTDLYAKLIKESAAYYALNDKYSPVEEAKAEDYIILKYYGNYKGCYAIILNHPYSDVPAVEIDEWLTIGSVMIHYTSHDKIVIWKS